MDFDMPEDDQEFTFDADQTLTDHAQALEDLDPASIDYSTADPEDITDVDQALKILKFLKTQDKGTTEEIYYNCLIKHLDI